MGHKRKSKLPKLNKTLPTSTSPPPIIGENQVKEDANLLLLPKERPNLKQIKTTDSILISSGYSILNKAATSLFLILLCVGIIRMILLLDFDKTNVFNHKPGVCRVVHNLVNGTHHMEYVSKLGILFITQPPSISSLLIPSKFDAESGSIFVLHIKNDENAKNKKFDNFVATKLNIEIKNSSIFNKSTFHPLGLSSTIYKSRITLYVVNGNPGKNTIEVFSYIQKYEKLIHLKTISDESFQSLRDVHVFNGGERLLLINSFYFKKSFLQMIEIGLQINSGNLLFFDGKKSKIIDKSVAFPTSIAVDNERNFVYVSSYTSEVIKKYKMERDFTLYPMGEIPLMSSPHQIIVESKSGDIWTAANPVFYRSFSFWNTLIESISPNNNNNQTSIKNAPSHILRVRFQEDKKSWVITEPFSNDGSSISSATSIALIGDLFALGSKNGKTFICQMNNLLLA
uniref:Arylesterase n=1 Tax=Panagrolaimus sp. PS1159 TaxID=55785 RepID=A0AC35GLD8_9BILA